MLFKLSNLNSKFAQILGYLNPALNNSALLFITSLCFLFLLKLRWPKTQKKFYDFFHFVLFFPNFGRVFLLFSILSRDFAIVHLLKVPSF